MYYANPLFIFHNRFNPSLPTSTPNKLIDIPDYIKDLQQQDFKIEEDTPTENEIKNVIRALKSVKSSSDISPNIVKEIINSKSATIEFNKLITTLWKTEHQPKKFGKSLLVAIKWKRKDSKSDPKNYRAIQVGSVFCKTLIILILNRFTEWYECQLLDCQNWFRRKRGRIDGIYTTKMMQHIASKTN